MRRRDPVNQSETKALELLERSLGGEGYAVWPGLPLKSIIELEDGDELTYAEKQMHLHGHVDFAVCGRETQPPSLVFAVEFDGPYHEDPDRQAKDRVKDGLCLRAGVPLIRIRSSAIGEKEQITILEWVCDCFRMFRRERRRVEMWAEYYKDMADEAAREGLYRPRADLGTVVHTLNPFPGNLRVRQRLEERFGIASPPRRTKDPWFEGDEAAQRAQAAELQRYLEAQIAFYQAPLRIEDMNDLDTPETLEDFSGYIENLASGGFQRKGTYELGVFRGSELLFGAETPSIGLRSRSLVKPRLWSESVRGCGRSIWPSPNTAP